MCSERQGECPIPHTDACKGGREAQEGAGVRGGRLQGPRSHTLQWVVLTGIPILEANTTVSAEASSIVNPLWREGGRGEERRKDISHCSAWEPRGHHIRHSAVVLMKSDQTKAFSQSHQHINSHFAQSGTVTDRNPENDQRTMVLICLHQEN